MCIPWNAATMLYLHCLKQEFIEKDAAQTEIVLQYSFNSPTMAGLMSQHFVPINNPYSYLTMYERLVQILQQQNPDLVFMLLTKVSDGEGGGV